MTTTGVKFNIIAYSWTSVEDASSMPSGPSLQKYFQWLTAVKDLYLVLIVL